MAAATAQLRRAVGSPRQVKGKLQRIRQAVALRADPKDLLRRLRRLHELGVIDVEPSRLQIRFAGMDMLRFCILPAAHAYYRQQGIDMRFHYFLRFLEDPMSMLDPVGLASPKATIIGHLLQSVHLNPAYDLQLLSAYESGLEDLEREAREVLAGTHARQSTISATVEDPDYHHRLLAYVERFRQDPSAEPPLRDVGALRDRPLFRLAEATFHTLPGFMRYASRLPSSLVPLLRHRRTTELDPRYCDRAAVEEILGQAAS